MESDINADISPKVSRIERLSGSKKPPVYLRCPKTFSHYVLNLPASALTFLPAFRGLYAGRLDLFEPNGSSKLPMVHVHCFGAKNADYIEEGHKICKKISAHLAHKMTLGDPEKDGEVEIWDVRDVAPAKTMFCASFRLPKKVAFAEHDHDY